MYVIALSAEKVCEQQRPPALSTFSVLSWVVIISCSSTQNQESLDKQQLTGQEIYKLNLDYLKMAETKY